MVLGLLMILGVIWGAVYVNALWWGLGEGEGMLGELPERVIGAVPWGLMAGPGVTAGARDMLGSL